MRNLILNIGFCLLVLPALAQQKTFTNPLLPGGPDPFSWYKDGYYYYTNSAGNRLVLWKTKNITDLRNAEKKTIYTPPPNTAYSKELWAPEVMFIAGKWYAYFAADDGDNHHHRMYVLENANPDPFEGEWVMKGKIADPTNKWAIDGDVFSYQGKLYMAWSGWEGDKNGQQDIYIAAMRNPWSIEGERVRISSPQYDWETHGYLGEKENPSQVNVNEGPQFLQHGKDLFIVFSASGCWTDFYALGLLRLTGSDPLNAAHWSKHPEPVFTPSPKNGVYGPGHNSFFLSPDGKENWILYHANANPGDGCGDKRSPRAQPFTWNADGMPNFGEPVKAGVPLPLPSGTK